jgi:TetR/AcrR family fatty acid metabolism transcriptional regulator
MSEASTRKLEKRARIVNAAVDIFAEKGFRTARVSDIARLAGVADGTIYLYFKSKEEILISIFEEKMDLLLTGLRLSLSEATDAPEKISRFATFHLGQVAANPATAEVLQIELRLSHKFLREYRPEKLWEYLGIFEDIVREGQKSGVFRQDVDPFVSSWSFFGGMDEIAMQWVLSKNSQRFNLDSAAHQIATIFTRGLAPQPKQ